MKILRLYTRLPPLLGGMEKHIAQLTREQIRLGHEVSIYFNQGDRVTCSDIRITKLPLFKIKPQSIRLLIFHFLVLVKVFVKREKFDIVHVHGDWSSLVFSKIIKVLVRADKVIITIHDQISDKLLYKKTLSVVLRFADVIFTTGYETANQLKRLTNKKIIVQPSGVSEIFFSEFNRNFESKKFTVVTVANLLPKKNIELILKIAKALEEFEFILIGEGCHRKVLESIVQRENIGNVKLAGFKTTKEVKEYYHQSDCYLLTSFAEGTPTAALEAMACGLPIVSSNAGGVEFVFGQNNFVLKSNDKQQFVKCLSRLSKDTTLRQNISKKNIAQSKKYLWKNAVKNIDLYLKR